MSAPIALIVGSLHYDIMVEASHLPRKDETAVGSKWYPKFGGKGMYGHFVHEAVVASGETESGITIHYVNEHYD